MKTYNIRNLFKIGREKEKRQRKKKADIRNHQKKHQKIIKGQTNKRILKKKKKICNQGGLKN